MVPPLAPAHSFLGGSAEAPGVYPPLWGGNGAWAPKMGAYNRLAPFPPKSDIYNLCCGIGLSAAVKGQDEDARAMPWHPLDCNRFPLQSVIKSL